MKANNEEIRLVEIDTDNFYDILDLKVTKVQKNYVASNIFSLAEAYANVSEGKYAKPFGIYAGEKAVGFVMIGYISAEDAKKEAEEDEDEEVPQFIYGSYLIWRFMVDKRYQKRGYGSKALKLALDFIRTFPKGAAEYCWLSYEPENEVAKKLYASFGFKEYDRLPKGWDEMPAILKL
ncbi:MAG: GNAT family N-acetyltransferase [Clostridia bacterium]|nr:GNAT family N-acetyltransferase [Clostridia bacterium]